MESRIQYPLPKTPKSARVNKWSLSHAQLYEEKKLQISSKKPEVTTKNSTSKYQKHSSGEAQAYIHQKRISIHHI